jgi:hypothetical protein
MQKQYNIWLAAKKQVKTENGLGCTAGKPAVHFFKKWVISLVSVYEKLI